MRFDVPHGCSNYEELTPDRQAEMDILTHEAVDLWHRAAAAGFTLTMEPERNAFAPPSMGGALTRITVRPRRILAT